MLKREPFSHTSNSNGQRTSTGMTQRVVLSVILFNIVLYALTGFALYQNKKQYEKEAHKTAQNLAQMFDLYLHGIFDKIDVALLSIKDDAESELKQKGKLTEAIETAIHKQILYIPEIDGLRLLDNQGNIRWGLGMDSTQTYNLSSRDFFIKAKHDSKIGLFISEPLLGTLSKQVVINLVRRINDPQNQFAGVVYAALPLSLFQKIFSSLDIGKNGEILLSFTNGIQIAQYPQTEEFSNKALPRLRLIKKISDFPLQISIGLAKTDYLADWRNDFYVICILLLFLNSTTILIAKITLAKWKQELKIEKQLEQSKMDLEVRVKERTQALNKANNVLLNIIDFLPDATFVINENKQVIAWNRAIEEMTGIPKEQILGQGDYAYTVPFYGTRRTHLLDLLETDSDEIKSKYKNIVKKGEILYAETHTPKLYGGKGAYVWATGAPLYDSEGNKIGAIESIRDITDRKEFERQLQQYADIVSRMQHGLYVYRLEDPQDDHSLRLIAANPASTTLLGMNPQEIINKKIDEIFPALRKNDLPARYKETALNKTPFEVMDYSFEISPGEFHYFDFKVFPLPDNCVGILFSEVTKRKQAEQERLELERKLLHAQKLESLGILAGGIAHDFNNLLSAILGNLDLALLRLSKTSPTQEFLYNAIKACHRATDLTRQMLVYSGKGLFQQQEVDLNQLVQDNYEFLKASISKSITFETKLASDPLRIYADPGQIQQVVMNLITNASEAIEKEMGVIALRTGRMYCDARLIEKSRIEEKPTPGDYIFIEVSDTGCGMSLDTQSKIFDPFFTTKFTGRGLGMAAVQGIVKAHQGMIWLDSKINAGTTFKILFPSNFNSPPHKIALNPAEKPWKKNATNLIKDKPFALIVDDEEGVRSLCAQFVRELGFQSLLASNGLEAISLFKKHQSETCLIVLDLTMPQMSGVNAFYEFKKLAKTIPILLCSGYNEKSASENFNQMKPEAFIQKPFLFEDFKNKIRLLMDVYEGSL